MRINHIALKTICIDPLSTAAKHHVENNNLNMYEFHLNLRFDILFKASNVGEVQETDAM